MPPLPRPQRKSTKPPQKQSEPQGSIYRGGKDRSGDIVEIPVTQLCPNPFNRREMSGVAELAATIEEVGLLQRIAHIPRDIWIEHYPETTDLITAENVILFGEHRWRAVRTLGWEAIESVLMDDKVADARVITLIENLRRAQLSPLEEAEHYEALRASGLSYEQIAKKVGETAKGSISKGTVWKRVQLLTLTPEVLDAVKAGKLAISNAEKLTSLSADDQRDAVALVKSGTHPVEARAQILARQRQPEDAPDVDETQSEDTVSNGNGRTESGKPLSTDTVSSGNGSDKGKEAVSTGNAASRTQSTSKRKKDNPSADQYERDRSAAAAARDAACQLLVSKVKVGQGDDRELLLAAMTAALLAPQQQSAAQQRALVWLRRAERHGIDEQNASAFFNAVQASGDEGLQQLAAFAYALAAAELRTAARRHSWGSRESGYVRLLQDHAQYVPSTEWEKKELGLETVGAAQ
ncbi:ParB/RepB/Spo0J family partition protein [Streptomyces anulatus]|uniref:ParB/RepB/Spo0J family partition protein n=1 Tax=Streptomyces anulatus TaxID=1892 RepID=UPI0033D2C355